jgi:16S rRNA (uracil1498-N3)-methyltransferase
VFVAALADTIEIDGDDGHHLQRARRLEPGERITAADNSGAWRRYEVTGAGQGRIAAAAAGAAQTEPRPSVQVALAVALTKGGIDDVVKAVTELGVARVTPVAAERAVARWDAKRAAAAVVRLGAIAREAAMQSRRTTIPVIDAVVAFQEIAARPHLVVADSGGRPAGALEPPRAGEWTVLVGPEGGFSDAERERLTHCPVLGVGNGVLRAATAPIAAVAVLADQIAQIAER